MSFHAKLFFAHCEIYYYVAIYTVDQGKYFAFNVFFKELKKF